MTTFLPTAVAERIRLGTLEGAPIGVVIKVRDRSELPAIGAIVDEMLGFARGRLAKARLPRSVRARERAAATIVPALTADLVEYFDRLLSRTGIKKALDVDPDDLDWKAERRVLRVLLEPFYVAIGDAAFDAASTELSADLSFDLESKVAATVRDRLAVNVAGILETTRELIRDYVSRANEKGYSIEQLVRGVDEDGFLGLGAIFGTRAETIARTETATAYNLSSSAAWRESGLVEQVVIFDGPECGWDGHDDPDLADGSIRTLDEFEETPTSHPNCQRAAGPVAVE